MRMVFYMAVTAILLSGDALADSFVPWIDHRQPRRTVTLEYLYESCAGRGDTGGGDIPYFDCETYVYGVLDSYILIRPSMPVSQRACFPTNLPPWLALEIAEPMLFGAKSGKGDGSAPAALKIIDALRKKYPCR